MFENRNNADVFITKWNLIRYQYTAIWHDVRRSSNKKNGEDNDIGNRFWDFANSGRIVSEW